MESNENKWTLGEIVTLDRKEKPLKKSGTTTYERFIICIREATEGQQGILMKVLGKPDSEQIKIVNGQPFCKDDYDELFEGNRFFSFPFPSANEVNPSRGVALVNRLLVC